MTASSPSVLKRRQDGFTLTELAVVFTIVALLLASAMYTLSAQTENRNLADSQRRLEDARDLLLAFAMVNGRLPCPARYANATSNSSGLESFCPAGTGTCSGTETTTFQSHGNCSNSFDGYLPAMSLGFTPVDQGGFGVDTWGNRIRYAVARKTAHPTGTTNCKNTAGTSLVGENLLYTKARATGESLVVCVPDEMVVCASATGVTATTCGTATSVTNQNLVAAVVFSTGKNFNTAQTLAALNSAGRTDEAANLNGDGVFIYHAPKPSTETNEFDDQVIWIPASLLYAKMIAAGVLP